MTDLKIASKVLVLCTILALMAVTVSAVSAKSVTVGNYIVSDKAPDIKASLNSPATVVSPLTTYYYIIQGQSRYHTSNLPSGIHWLELDLNWGNSANSLDLTIYSPSGNNLGTYNDMSDGRRDGRIHLSVYPSGGYIDPGMWVNKVYGASVSGSQRYTFNVYGH